MGFRLGQPWISAERVDGLVQLEPILMIVGLSLAAIVIYKFFLRSVSDQRHQNLKRLFKNLSAHLLGATVTFVGYYAVQRFYEVEAVARVDAWLGLISILWWSIVFVKVSRILLFEYLFLSHMRVGVPLLLVNLFTLLLTILLGGWLATVLFDVKVMPLLATSAIFSVVLGLALQDTLGNLFAGVAMQFDKPYEIGDWIEVTVNGQKWAGQVHEISWRATVMLAMGDEQISVPNRLMGQTQIVNFATKKRPFWRSQLFRISHGSSIAQAKNALVECSKSIPSILQDPKPFSYAFETSENFVTLKLVYAIKDYGLQFLIGDEVIEAGNKALQSAGFELAPSRLLIMSENTAKEKTGSAAG